MPPSYQVLPVLHLGTRPSITGARLCNASRWPSMASLPRRWDAHRVVCSFLESPQPLALADVLPADPLPLAGRVPPSSAACSLNVLEVTSVVSIRSHLPEPSGPPTTYSPGDFFPKAKFIRATRWSYKKLEDGDPGPPPYPPPPRGPKLPPLRDPGAPYRAGEVSRGLR